MHATVDAPENDTRQPDAIFLMGPTAAGKTELALALAERLSCEIVSVDSAMIYRGMDIGTAKPSPAQQAVAPHRLIDILDPAETYSTARFRTDALAAMAEIAARGQVPLLVGGTMLYFRALQQGLARLPGADAGLRQRLLEEAAACGWPAMHARLTQLDPVSAARIHPNDPQRIQRALEVCELAGRPLSALLDEAQATRLPYRTLKLVRAPVERALLHTRIAQRFHAMLEQGLIGEVEGLYARGDLHADLPSMRCVGYRQVLGYLTGDYGWQEMVERAIIASRQLAKRQFTWLRAESDTHWLTDDAGAVDQALELVEQTVAR